MIEKILAEFRLENEKIEKFKKYYLYLVEENTKINLTSIISEKEVYIKHFYDSLSLSKMIDFTKINSFLDVGSGAGFPGMALKIAFPELRLTIIEPTLKRVKFLNDLTNLLELKDVVILNARAEDSKVVSNLRESQDIVSARAVASLPVLLELVIPYLKVNGIFLAPKGPSYLEELEQSETALRELNSKILDIHSYDLPNEAGKRFVLKIMKEKPTKKIYPRPFSQIKKKNL